MRLLYFTIPAPFVILDAAGDPGSRREPHKLDINLAE